VKLAPIKNQRKEDVAVGNRKEEEAEQVQEVRDASSHIYLSSTSILVLIYLPIVIMTFVRAHV
jgi:hypothetical protein